MTKNNTSLETKVAVIANDTSYLKTEIAEIKEMLSSKFVSHDEFNPVKRLVYGLVSIILGGVIIALLTTVFKK